MLNIQGLPRNQNSKIKVALLFVSNFVNNSDIYPGYYSIKKYLPYKIIV